MPYIQINGTEYMVRDGEGRGQRVLVENRRRAVDASLLVDRIAGKSVIQTELVGRADDNRFFTAAEANAFISTLEAGAIVVVGDAGSLTARAKDIGWVDAQHYPNGPFTAPVLYRWVSVTLEEV